MQVCTSRAARALLQPVLRMQRVRGPGTPNIVDSPGSCETADAPSGQGGFWGMNLPCSEQFLETALHLLCMDKFQECLL